MAEKTAEKHQVEEEDKKKQEIEELEKQIAETSEKIGKQETPTPKEEETAAEEELCSEHQRKVEIICITDRSRICSNCALFGAHKGHDIRMENEVVSEITLRTELLMQIY